MAKANPKQEKDNGIRQEILGIALFAVALYSAISLFSSWREANWGGWLGELLSRAFLASIGYTSFVFPFILLLLSVGLVLRRFFRFRVVVPVSFLFFVLSSSALLSLIAMTEEAGGFVGAFLSRLLSDVVGATGAIIFLSAVILMTLLVATGLSIIQLAVKALPPTVSVFRFLVERMRHEKENDEDEDEDEIEEEPAPKREKKIVEEKPKVLEKKLQDFGIDGRVLEVRPGPVVTMYEFEPAPGVKVGRITNLSDDLALAMKAMSIRIIAPIPGKAVVGIEVPNHSKEMILLREMLECPAFSKSRSHLSLALGKD